MPMAKENREHKSSVFADLFGSDEHAKENILELYNCIFREICASVPKERSAIPLETEQSSVGSIGYLFSMRLSLPGNSSR
jgi:hypothetical protein